MGDEETRVIQRYQERECANGGELIFAGLEADRADVSAGSMLAEGELRDFKQNVLLAKKAGLDCVKSHGAVEAVKK